jgi:hypothetical protein
MHNFGIFIGWMIIAGYLLAVMNYFVKLINKKVSIEMSIDPLNSKKHSVLLQYLVKSHIYIGLYLATLILLHLMIELVHRGFYITGMILGGLMIVQILLGAYGAFVKGRIKGQWFYAHRIVAAMIFVAIIVHVIAVISLLRSGVA